MKLKSIKILAKEKRWDFLCYQENIKMASFTKTINGEQARINIYHTTMTVATCINHPKKGKTQLFRKGVDNRLLAKIFKNPRIHTDKGYQTK